MHYKPAPGRLRLTRQHDTVQQNDDDHLNKVWREEMTMTDRYKNHRPECLNMLKKFEGKRDGHLELITTSGHRIEPTSDNVCAVYSAPY